VTAARIAFAVAALSGLVACGGGSGDDDDGPAEIGLAPTFPGIVTSPLPGASSTTTGPGGTDPAATGTTAAGATVTPGSTPSDPAAPRTASITDPEGDVTLSIPDPPPWADLVGGRLTRSAEGFELRVTLGGGAAPEGSGSPDETMNVASFYDVDGDGSIDYEVWANLADGGWGGAWFNDREGGAHLGDEAQVDVTIEGADVVLRFPLAYVADATTFRWSLASEWGRYEMIGTDLAARDDAPDDDQPADFPN
jgi:hypothetical protein